MLEQSQLTGETLLNTVIALLSDQGRLRAMGQAARQLSHPKAAQEIAEIAAQLADVK